MGDFGLGELQYHRVAYLRKKRSKISLNMCRLASEIIDWSELYMLTVMARYIFAMKNVLSDWPRHLDLFFFLWNVFFLGCWMASARSMAVPTLIFLPPGQTLNFPCMCHPFHI